MIQTVKFGKMRAKNDPDRDTCNHGTYYGNNLPDCYNYSTDWAHRYRTTRGSFVKRGQ